MAARNLAWATLLGVVGLAAQGGARFLHTTWVGNTAPDRLGTLSALLSISVFLTLLGPAAAGIAAGIVTRRLENPPTNREVPC